MMRLQMRGLLPLVAFSAIGLTIIQLAWSDDARRTESPAKAQARQTAKESESDGAEPKPILQNFMRTKLSAASRVLEGLATDDFDLIREGADSLGKISRAEEWRISNDPSYAARSDDFRRRVERLATSAEKRNLDGAALAHVEVTMSCIECHKWVRNVLMAADGETSASGRPTK